MPSVITLEGLRHQADAAIGATFTDSPVVEWLRQRNTLVALVLVIGMSMGVGAVIGGIAVKGIERARKAMR